MPDKHDIAPPRQVDDLIVDFAALFSHDAAPASAAPVTQPPPPPHTDDPVVATYELALDVAAQPTMDAMLRRLVDDAQEVFSARSAVLVVGGQDGDAGTMLLAGESPVAGMEGWRTDSACPVTGGAAPGAPLLFRRSSAGSDGMGMPPGHLPIESVIGAPMGDGGFLCLIDRTDGGEFDADDLQRLQRLAWHAARVLERAGADSGFGAAQQRVEAQLSQMRIIMDTLPAGVLVLAAPDGRVELANKTAVHTMLGGDASEGAELRVYRDFNWFRADGTELPRTQHPGMIALRGEIIGNRALTLETRDGKRIPVRVQSTPIYDTTGRVARAVVLFLDVSRERAAEQIKDDFLSLISHEFRTPLTAIHGGALLLAQQGQAMDDEMRRELLQDIGEESLRLDRMLGNLLSVSEIMAGRFEASTEPILVAPLVQPLIDEFRDHSPGHTLTLEVEEGVPPAEGSPELLKQILRNLYENAVKYSPGGGEIRTAIALHDDHVSIRVIDQGLGIAGEHVPHVFERFRRPGADPTVRGMGLGLYLSRLLVDAQGGRIRAYSPGPGHGATFEVELPMVPDWERERDLDDEDPVE